MESPPGAARIVILLCAAEVLGMAGFSSFAALLPFFSRAWQLSNTEAGWIGGIYYAGYTAAVPVLVSLTDRGDARKIYLFSTALAGVASLLFALVAQGFWSAFLLRGLAGIGLAGTYMPGLRALSDRLEGTAQARAIAFYTSSFGIGASASFLFTGLVDEAAGWQMAFGAAALGSVVAGGLALWALRSPSVTAATRLLGIRPVLSNRAVMACVIAYAAHNFELFGFRGWITAFLAFSTALTGSGGLGSAALIAAGITIVSLPGSILGNELALRRGRRRTIILVMSASALVACVIGFTASLPFGVVIALTLVYGTLVSADSSALTSSLVASADADLRGLTMAVYSCIGFVGAFLGPLAFGVALDWGGADRIIGWGAGFATMGIGVAIGPLAFVLLAPRIVEPAHLAR